VDPDELLDLIATETAGLIAAVEAAGPDASGPGCPDWTAAELVWHIAEVQDLLEDDDCMLPWRWRKVSDLTLAARTDAANEVLRNGIDRSWDGADNGVWVAPGEESVVYSWKKPVTLSGARLIFDSHFKVRSKRMRKLEATTERVEVPPMMARAWRLEARVKGAWKTVYEEKDNYLRLRQIRFAPVSADALRIVIDQTWGADKAHIFAFDAR
jgi:hypothetical protein